MSPSQQGFGATNAANQHESGESAKRAKEKDEREKAKKIQQQADANAARATFVASMAQVIVALCTQSAAQQAKQRCNY